MSRLPAEERRRQLLRAAREEFARVGPEGARISDIAARAGVNVALLYRYFDSKEQLFEEAIIEPLEGLLDRMLGATEEPSEAVNPDSVHAFYRGLLQIFDKYFELFGVVLFSDRDQGFAFYTRHVATFMDRVSDRVRTAGPGWPQRFDPALTTPMCIGMCWGVVMDAHFRRTELDVEAVAASLAEITMRGLLP